MVYNKKNYMAYYRRNHSKILARRKEQYNLNIEHKINSYRTRELNGEVIPRDEYNTYIDLKRQLYHIKAKERLNHSREVIRGTIRDKTQSVSVGEATLSTPEVYDFEPMLIRIEKKSRLRMLLDRFRREI